MRILLVEDEKPLSRAICASLAREAFTVDPVYTGPDGLEAAKTGEYDAVILDVMLPGMDGFTVLEHLRAGGVSTPVLILTARGSGGSPPARPGRAGGRRGLLSFQAVPDAGAHRLPARHHAPKERQAADAPVLWRHRASAGKRVPAVRARGRA